jgi:chromosome segregation ATPase
MVCLPADLTNLRKANAHFAMENHELQEKVAAHEDALRNIALFLSCGGYNDCGLVEFDPALYAKKIKEEITEQSAKVAAVKKNLVDANKGAERNMNALNISCQKLEELERERDGWREAAYALAEAIPASWEELQPPAEQLRKFKEMVALQNEKTKKLLDIADQWVPRYINEALPPSWETQQPPAEQLRKFKEMVALQNEKTKNLRDIADKHSKMYP